MKPKAWRNRTPTKKQIAAAYSAQAPTDREVKPLTKRPVLKPNYGGKK